jgi:hypothetical protein
MGSIGATGSGATQASLVAAAENDTEKTAKLLKKSLSADQDLVNTLLPTSGGAGGQLNILA